MLARAAARASFIVSSYPIGSL